MRSPLDPTGSSARQRMRPLGRLVHCGRLPLAWLWAHGFRFLWVLDAVALFGCMVGINLVRFAWPWPTYPFSHYLLGFTIATVVHLVVGYFGGLYEREPTLGSRPWLPQVAIVSAIAIAVDATIFLLTERYLMPRLNLAILFITATALLTLNRGISRVLAVRRRGPSRVLLVGALDDATRARVHLDAEERDAMVVAVQSTTCDLVSSVIAAGATDVLLLELTAFESAFPEPLSTLERQGVGVHQRVSARETLLGLRSVRQIAGMPFTRLRAHAVSAHQLRLKRLFDLAVLVVTAPLTSLTIAALAIYVWLRTGRPIIYRQRRVGRAGEVFEVVKFRTMAVDAEATGPQLAAPDDPRVIAGLGWMRASRADELPQLWNILRGQMSLVGPRPERPEFVDVMGIDVPGYLRRLELPPGLTGLAQVHGRYHTAPEDKLGYDLQYLVTWSLALDVQILLRTAWVVIRGRV